MTEFIKTQQPIGLIRRTATYRHELSAGADKLSEAEQEVLFSWENLGQLDREMRGKWKGWEHKMAAWAAGREKLETGLLFVSNILQMDKPDINNEELRPQKPAQDQLRNTHKLLFFNIEAVESQLPTVFVPFFLKSCVLIDNWFAKISFEMVWKPQKFLLPLHGWLCILTLFGHHFVSEHQSASRWSWSFYFWWLFAAFTFRLWLLILQLLTYGSVWPQTRWSYLRHFNPPIFVFVKLLHELFHLFSECGVCWILMNRKQGSVTVKSHRSVNELHRSLELTTPAPFRAISSSLKKFSSSFPSM